MLQYSEEDRYWKPVKSWFMAEWIGNLVASQQYAGIAFLFVSVRAQGLHSAISL